MEGPRFRFRLVKKVNLKLSAVRIVVGCRFVQSTMDVNREQI